MKMLLVLVVGVYCIQQPHIANVMAQLDKLPNRNDFSKEIAGLVELKMMQSSGVSEVLKEIKEIRDQLSQDQVVEDQEFANRIGYLNVEIEILEYQVDKLSNQLKATNTQLGELNGEIATLIGSQKSITGQLTLLNSKEEEIRNGFTQQQQDVKNRQVNNEKVVEALNEIIYKLQTAVFAAQDRQTVLSEVHKKQVVDQIKSELGALHPIAAFVSVTTRFDVPTVKKVIQLLENIRDNTIQQSESDQEQLTASSLAYDSTIKEVTDVRDRLTGDLYRVNQVLKRRNDERVLAEKTKKQIEKDLPIALDLLSSLRNQREVVQATYNQRRSRRENEIKVIQQAYNIVAQQVR
ncbi:hypothetical protein pb186bvf_002139 [Paramecium bursaria]